MDWHYSHSGSQQGPISQDELQQKISAGELSRHEKVWREGMQNWITVEQSGAFQLPSAASTTSTSIAPSTSSPTSPHLTSQAGGPKVPQGLGIASLICGLIAALCGFAGCCLWFIALPFGAAAVVMGHLQSMKLKKANASEGKVLVLTGLIGGYIGIALGLLFAIFFAITLATGSNETEPGKIPPFLREIFEKQGIELPDETDGKTPAEDEVPIGNDQFESENSPEADEPTATGAQTGPSP